MGGPLQARTHSPRLPYDDWLKKNSRHPMPSPVHLFTCPTSGSCVFWVSPIIILNIQLLKLLGKENILHLPVRASQSDKLGFGWLKWVGASIKWTVHFTPTEEKADRNPLCLRTGQDYSVWFNVTTRATHSPLPSLSSSLSKALQKASNLLQGGVRKHGCVCFVKQRNFLAKKTTTTTKNC